MATHWSYNIRNCFLFVLPFDLSWLVVPSARHTHVFTVCMVCVCARRPICMSHWMVASASVEVNFHMSVSRAPEEWSRWVFPYFHKYEVLWRGLWMTSLRFLLLIIIFVVSTVECPFSECGPYVTSKCRSVAVDAVIAFLPFVFNFFFFCLARA